VAETCATGAETKLKIIDRTAEDDGIGFIMVGTGTFDAAQDESWRLFGEILSPSAVEVDDRPRGAEGNVLEGEADAEAAAGREVA